MYNLREPRNKSSSLPNLNNSRCLNGEFSNDDITSSYRAVFRAVENSSLQTCNSSYNSQQPLINEEIDFTLSPRKKIFVAAFCEEINRQIENKVKFFLSGEKPSQRINPYIIFIQHLMNLTTAGVASYHLVSHITHDQEEKTLGDVEAILTIIPLILIPFMSITLSLLTHSNCISSNLEKLRKFLYATNKLRINNPQEILRATADRIFSQYEVTINNIENAEISGGLDMALRSLAHIAVDRIITSVEKKFEVFKTITSEQMMIEFLVNAVQNTSEKKAYISKLWKWAFGRKKTVNYIELISGEKIQVNKFFDLCFSELSGVIS